MLQEKINAVIIPLKDPSGKKAFIQTIGKQSVEWFISAVIFNGLGDDGEALRRGIYIIFLEAINEGAGIVKNYSSCCEEVVVIISVI